MNVADGTDFAGYRIERRLGAGGMGEVYLARHPRLPRYDALKILSDQHASDAEFRARFLREAEAAVRLQHPNVVAVRDRGEHDGRLWIAMQYVDGGDVADLIRRDAAIPVERALRILAEAAQGLDEIHRVGLQHRDVKPANLLLAEEPGALDRVLVTDFGIARIAGAEGTLSEGGGFTATLAYAAPELISAGTVDHRADVYSLGCTLYQLLTGSVPYPRSSPAAVMYAHLNEEPPRPSRENARVPTGLDKVIATALAKNPADRYQSCGALAAAAQAACSAEAAAGAMTGSMRRRGASAGAAIAAIVLVLIGVSLAVGFGRDGSAGSSASSPTRVATNSAAWGAAALAAETFPNLLPVAPAAVGYQDLHTCMHSDQNNNLISFDQQVPTGGVFCLGDREPAEAVVVICNSDRTPIPAWPPIAQLEGEELWSRDSASGRVRWGTVTTNDGVTVGRLDVMFDRPDRNFCRLRVGGALSGSVLRERWWPDAPL
ncbi:serine/threonine-protein kinase [Nocardia asiatica]|uniref:serine/threonine-protein kinase n=1 Tax=Nocardia asiatica TaxID=209252 RepID=UPI0024578025|nr:serine/threonine-protein kinase [Nocardia asiatica]